MDIRKKVSGAFINHIVNQTRIRRGTNWNTLAQEFFLGAAAACEDNSEDQKHLMDFANEIKIKGYRVIEKFAEEKYEYNS